MRYRYFTGALLDAASFQLDQHYLRGTGADPRRGTAVWLEVDEGDGFQPWHEVAHPGCARDERWFLLDRQVGVSRFGDGRTGRRPRPCALLRGWYRRGAGAYEHTPEPNESIPRAELVRLLAEVSHFTWMRQAAKDEGLRYEALDPHPTEHDLERAEDIVAELNRLRLLGCNRDQP